MTREEEIRARLDGFNDAIIGEPERIRRSMDNDDYRTDIINAVFHYSDDIDYLLKENQRLREALEQISVTGYRERDESQHYSGEYHAECLNIARQTLDGAK